MNQPGNQQLAASRRDLFQAISALEKGVAAWFTTPAAWDQRTHPSIKQYLRDIREYATALDGGGKSSTNLIVVEAERLGSKVCDATIAAHIRTLREALEQYSRDLHA